MKKMKLCVLSISAALLAFVGNGARTDSPSRSADPVKARITVLYDAFGQDSAMQKDWGYAAFVEYGGKRILFDTGNNPDILAQNAKAKGIDLSKLDFAIVSHRHGDHMGGLTYLLRVNPRVIVYAPNSTSWCLLIWAAWLLLRHNNVPRFFFEE